MPRCSCSRSLVLDGSRESVFASWAPPFRHSDIDLSRQRRCDQRLPALTNEGKHPLPSRSEHFDSLDVILDPVEDGFLLVERHPPYGNRTNVSHIEMRMERSLRHQKHIFPRSL